MRQSNRDTVDTARSVVEALRDRYSNWGEGPTTGFFDRRSGEFSTESSKTFLLRAATVASTLKERGVEPGDHILIGTTSPAASWLGFLGSLLAEAVPALLPVRPTFDPPALTEARLRDASKALPTAHLMLQVGASGSPCIVPNSSSWIPLDLSVEPAADLPAPTRSVAASVPVHLQFTSGSTGTLKPVVMTDQNVLTQAAALHSRIGLDANDSFVSWLPLYHDMGLMGIAMASLLNGNHLRLLSPFDFLADPTNWLRAVSGVQSAISAAPNFAFDYTTRRAREGRMDGVDLSSWKKCYCGAEPVDPRTLARFYDRFREYGLAPTSIHPTYGLAEATLMVTMPHTGDLPRQTTIRTDSISSSGPIEAVGEGPLLDATEIYPGATPIASLGPIADGVRIEIVADDGQPIESEGIAGEVVVSGPSVTPGYLQPDGTIDGDETGRCRTGDIGFMANNELYLIERTKNIIIRNGQNYSAAVLERQLSGSCELPLDNCAVIEASISGADNEILAVIEEPRVGFPPDLETICQKTVSDLDLPIDRVVLIGRNSIPRTTSGKKRHAELRAEIRRVELVVERQFSARADVNESDTVIDIDVVDQESRTITIIERHARRRGWTGDSISEHDRLGGDLGLDSLGLIELTVDLEASLSVSVPETRLHEIETVRDLLDAASEGASEMSLTSALTEISEKIPQIYRRVDLQQGRQLRIDGRWITDFASCNYLGLDLHPDVISSVGPAVAEWGTHPSWTRAVASPALYFELEAGLAELIGAPDVMVFSSISLLHLGVIPRLAGRGDTLIVDRTAHHSIQEAVEVAQARGARVEWFDYRDLDSLSEALGTAQGRTTIALDGVYSMSGDVPDLRSMEALAAEADATLYVDDAHGLGILGHDPGPDAPYGLGGGGVVQHLGLNYDNIIYVAGLSKAFSSMAGFVTCRNKAERTNFEMASTSIFSGPIPVASMATALAGIEANRKEGDERRTTVWHLTDRIIRGADERGFAVENELSFPIVNIEIGTVAQVVEASQIMWEHGILFTPSVFPAAPLDRGGLRLSLTAANTDDEVTQFLEALDDVVDKVGVGASATGAAARPEV